MRLIGGTCVASVVVLALCVWTLCFDGSTGLSNLFMGIRTSVYRTTMGVSASLLGFSLTVTTVVLGLSSSERLAVLRNSTHFPTVWRSFFRAIHALGWLLIISMLALILDRDERPVVVLEIAFLGLCVLAGVRLCRSLWILRRMVEVSTMRSRSAD